MKRPMNVIEAIYFYVSKHPGAGARRIYKAFPKGALPCGFEDIQVALRILLVTCGGLQRDSRGRYWTDAQFSAGKGRAAPG